MEMKLMQDSANEMKGRNLNNLNGDQIVDWIESNVKNSVFRYKIEISSIILHLVGVFNEAKIIGNIDGMKIKIIILQSEINKTYNILKNNFDLTKFKDPFSSSTLEPEKRCIFLLKKIKQSNAKMIFGQNNIEVVLDVSAKH